MVKKHMKGSDNKYHIGGKVYDMLIGSRAQVWHGTAYKTAGNLKKDNLYMNKHGRIVSKRKHETAKKEKRLQKHGYFTKKGTFGAIKKGKSLVKKSKKANKSKKSKKGGKSCKKGKH